MTRVSLPAASSSGSKKNGSWPAALSKSVGEHSKVNDKPVWGIWENGGRDTVAVMRLEPKDHKQKDSEISLIGGLFDR